ncbi:hypothetical protein F0562_017318 [Nyssa sinensis]|uniref:F-box domain-containing protein n=1 Tax=Nyssa sinensis TaxID=561372 RepID=A0A5J4ZG97_9ASTE|nr:hypothetical protein F0562_017318 [Nyssa sinensis]
MSDLPAQVVTDILSRLPVKTLLRFRCVSKPWCALIDSPDFVKFHLKRSIETKSNLSLILRCWNLYSVDLESLDNALELDHPLKSDNYVTEVLGSCNGLLCLANSEEDIVLWNPSIRKHRKLPVMPIELPPPEFCFCQFIVYGFGHDVVNDEYKLVRLVQFYGDDDDSFDSEVKVYNLKSNSWRRIPDFPYYLRDVLGNGSNGMLVSAALHWVVTREPKSDTSNLIAAFDIGTEEYRLVPQPEYSDENFLMDVGVLGGCLIIFCNYYSEVDIWLMKEYGVKESWTNLFSVSQPTVIRSFEYLNPIAYSKSGEEVLLEQDREKLLWYNLKNKTVKNVRIRGMPNSFSTDICLGSLVPPGGDGTSDGKKQPAQEKTKMKKKKKGKERDDFL